MTGNYWPARERPLNGLWLTGQWWPTFSCLLGKHHTSTCILRIQPQILELMFYLLFFNRDIIALPFCLLYLCISNFFIPLTTLPVPKLGYCGHITCPTNALLCPHYLSRKWAIVTTLPVPKMGHCDHITCPTNALLCPHYLSQKCAVITTLPVSKWTFVTILCPQNGIL